MQTRSNNDHTTDHLGFFESALIILIPALIISYITFSLVITLSAQDVSDYNGHLYIYITTFTGEDALSGYMMSPYFLWHIIVIFFYRVLLLPLDVSGAVCTVIFMLASFFLTVFMISRFCSFKKIRVPAPVISFSAFALTMLQSIWINFLDAGLSRTVGAFSINPIYNPTQTAARPFALICFMLLVDWWKKRSDEDSYIFFSLKKRSIEILLSVMLFFSAFAKPVFAEMFIPAVGIIMLARLIKAAAGKKDPASYFKNDVLKALLIALPCILAILMQSFMFFAMGGSYTSNEGIVITKWLEVWGSFTENVPLSILFSMSFPILILVMDFKNYMEEDFGSLGIVCYITGFLECALLGEGGNKLFHGNFIWPMMFGMLILWISAFLHFFSIAKNPDTGKKRALIILGWILILIHLHYGFLYYKDILGQTFFM